MMEQYLAILRQYWGYECFRGIQEQIIRSIGDGRDTLGLMPTGGGKSICFQVPALAKKGLCIVVTPLISLMKDQVRHLKARGIKAEAVYSGMSRDDIVRVLDNCVLGDYKFLYISPERLVTDLFQAKLVRMPHISMLVVDEAHCISQWGYDFRPSYLRIAEVRSLLRGQVPVLALTATATPAVADDIQDKLRFGRHNVFSMSYERENLIYVVRETENKLEEIAHVLRGVPQGSAIVYIRNRDMTREVAKQLCAMGFAASSYHAGLSHAERDQRQNDWMEGRIRVMVATNAFGMGIDKSDVRVVIHYSAPDTLEAYFQEAGRAGRDGLRSYAVLLYDRNDMAVYSRRVQAAYPPLEYIRGVYESMCYYFEVGVGEAEGRTFFFNVEDFCRRFRLFGTTVVSSLQILSHAGYVDFQADGEFSSRVQVLLRKEDLYDLRSSDLNADAVLTALLRNYSGLFAEPVTVEETFIAQATGLTPTEVYLTLKQLDHQHVIRFIPHRTTPTLTYVLPRVETSQVDLPASVYLDRKEDFIRRNAAVMNYVLSTDVCRNRMLREYLGETGVDDCGRCDVCLSRTKGGEAEKEYEENIIETRIRQLLADAALHPLDELKALPFRSSAVWAVLHRMLREDVVMEGTAIYLNS